MDSPAGGAGGAPAAARYNTRRRKGTRAAIRRAAEAVMRGEGVEEQDEPATAAPSSSTLAAAGLHDPEQLTWDQIKRVQSLIERCLAQYMTQTEIITALHRHAGVEPSVTCVVWQKLEEQNAAFFYAYSMRLRLKDQITAFNYLVSQQMRLRAGESLASLTGGAAAAPDPGPTPQAAPPPEVSRQEIDVAQFLANTPLGQQARGGSFFNGTGPAAQGGDA